MDYYLDDDDICSIKLESYFMDEYLKYFDEIDVNINFSSLNQQYTPSCRYSINSTSTSISTYSLESIKIGGVKKNRTALTIIHNCIRNKIKKTVKNVKTTIKQLKLEDIIINPTDIFNIERINNIADIFNNSIETLELANVISALIIQLFTNGFNLSDPHINKLLLDFLTSKLTSLLTDPIKILFKKRLNQICQQIPITRNTNFCEQIIQLIDNIKSVMGGSHKYKKTKRLYKHKYIIYLDYNKHKYIRKLDKTTRKYTYILI